MMVMQSSFSVYLVLVLHKLFSGYTSHCMKGSETYLIILAVHRRIFTTYCCFI